MPRHQQLKTGLVPVSQQLSDAVGLTQSVRDASYENNALELIEHNYKHRVRDLELFLLTGNLNGLNWGRKL